MSDTGRTVPQATTQTGGEPSTGGAKRKKRKRDEDRNEFLPDRSRDELDEQAVGSLEFNEVLDEEVRVRLSLRLMYSWLRNLFHSDHREVLLLLLVLIPWLKLHSVCPGQG